MGFRYEPLLQPLDLARVRIGEVARLALEGAHLVRVRDRGRGRGRGSSLLRGLTSSSRLALPLCCWPSSCCALEELARAWG